jgi:TolB protein
MVLSATGNSELYIANSMGANATRITRNNSLEASPSWKPDGTELVFTSDSMGKPQLYRIPSKGGKMTRIATQISNYCAEPDWNPLDPSKIVFTAVFREGFQVVLWDFKTNKSTILTRGARDSIEPCWLDDGRHIVFTRRVGAKKQLMVIDSESLQERAISSPRFGNTTQADAVYPR